MQRRRGLLKLAGGLRGARTGQFPHEQVQVQGTGRQGQQVTGIGPRQ